MSSKATTRSLTLAVLDVYFDEVVLLETYLRDILAPLSCGSDTSNADILRRSVKHFQTASVLRGDTADDIKMFSQVIQKAHERLFLASRSWPSNIIASGYQRVPDTDRVNASSSGITNRFVNTIVTALHAPVRACFFVVNHLVERTNESGSPHMKHNPEND
ncbi:hypothetical protein BS17DRAFT_817383 [Gyrodon lividus]|nr:hypothetical protein BS17DRAFT_817383 [Gyrodon lividus]